MALSLTFSTGIFPAFSPCKLTVTREIGDVTEVEITFAQEDTTEIAVLNVEIFGLSTSIDMSTIIQYLFTNELVEIGSNTTCKVFKDYRLYKPFGVRIPPYSPGYYLDFIAVNAVLPAGIAISTFVGWRSAPLTKFPKIYFWKGYTEKSVLSILTDVSWPSTLRFHSAAHDIDRVVSSAGEVYDKVVTANMDGQAIWDTDPLLYVDVIKTADSTVLWRKSVEERCIPENPCFIRWINSVGGWDHWMFSGKRDTAIEISDQVVFRERVTDNSDTANNYHTISGTRGDSIKVGTQGISTEDLLVLVQIVASPLIQMYDTTNSQWITILNDGSKPVWDSNEPKHTIDFQFKLPSINVQSL